MRSKQRYFSRSPPPCFLTKSQSSRDISPHIPYTGDMRTQMRQGIHLQRAPENDRFEGTKIFMLVTLHPSTITIYNTVSYIRLLLIEPLGSSLRENK